MPVSDVAMPQLRMCSGTTPAALLIEVLIVEGGCLRVREEVIDASYLVIWQPDYYLSDHDGRSDNNRPPQPGLHAIFRVSSL